MSEIYRRIEDWRGAPDPDDRKIGGHYIKRQKSFGMRGDHSLKFQRVGIGKQVECCLYMHYEDKGK
jgi:hypothetical protein